MTSYANENMTNMALNVWWYNNNTFHPKDCTLTPEEATLDKFKFQDQNEKYDGPSSEEGEENTEKPYE